MGVSENGELDPWRKVRLTSGLRVPFSGQTTVAFEDYVQRLLAIIDQLEYVYMHT